MSEIILVRHGQANTHATDEVSYDQLSQLGREQARWLGAHMGTTNPHFDRVISGSLTRQVETAQAMGYAPHQQDNRLNELSYFELTHAVERQFGLPAPAEAAEFARYMPQVMDYWAQGALEGIPEPFETFEARVRGLLDELCEGGGRTLAVTSGGVIGMVLSIVLALDTRAMTAVMLQVMNSSMHRLHYIHGQLMLATFNATPHLDAPERAHARTFI